MDHFTTKQLKEQLKRRGLKTSGRKIELFSRLNEALTREYAWEESSRVRQNNTDGHLVQEHDGEVGQEEEGVFNELNQGEQGAFRQLGHEEQGTFGKLDHGEQGDLSKLNRWDQSAFHELGREGQGDFSKLSQERQRAVIEVVLDNDVPQKNDEVYPEDSISQRGSQSKVSRMSGCSGSSVTKQRKLAAAKRAALEAKMSRLRELEETEQEEQRVRQEQERVRQEQERVRQEQERVRQEQIQVKQRRERILMEAELAAAQAEERALSVVSGKQDRSILDSGRSKASISRGLSTARGKKGTSIFDSGLSKTSNSKSLSVTRDMQDRSIFDCGKGKVSNFPKGDLKKDDRKSVGDHDKMRENHRDFSNIPAANSDRTLIETLISCNLKGLMPSQEVRKFNGDHTMYHLFIRSFESVISSKLTSDNERLHYLEQYTMGRANEIVRACLHLDPSEGYKRAREMLHKRYGNPERIVTAFVERVLNWKEINRDDVEGLDEFSVMLASCRNAVSCVPHGSAELQNPETMRKILNKLPFNIQDRWRREADDIMTNKGREVIFNDLVNYIEREARVMKNPLFGKHLFSNKEKDRNTRGRNNSVNTQAEQRTGHRVSCNNTKGTLACWYCKGSHLVDNCDQIKSMVHQERLEAVKKLGLCFGCLRSGHRSKDCRNKKSCEECQGIHPSLLHKTILKSPAHLGDLDTGVVSQDGDDNQVNVAIYTSIQENDCRGMSVVPVRVRASNGKETLTSAFLDNGSSATFCTKRLMNRLGLDGYSCNNINLFTTTIHGKREMKCALISGLSVCDLSGNNSIALPPLYAIDSIPVEKGDLVKRQDLQRWKHLQSLELPEISTEVELMIGTNVPHALEPQEVINSTKEFEPYAIKTKLGWVICGIGGDINSQTSVHRVSVSYSQKLDKMLIDSYNKDFSDLASSERELSVEDKQWLEIVEKGCKLVEGKYEIPLPLCSNIGILPESKPAALRRSYGLRKKLLRDRNYASQYTTFMNEMLEKGYAEPVQSPTNGSKTPNTWYIPHFGVCHSDKPDKVRVVFDCAARVNGLALNDILLQGPDMINSLLGVLLRFRLDKYAYTADIETMFYQVKVPVCDRDFLRFFWWPNGNFVEEPEEFRMCVHLFGACSSPSIANFALKRISHDFGQEFSDKARQTISSSFYVDDCLSSEETLQELTQNAMEVKHLCELGGFHLTKFVSPNKELLECISPGFTEEENSLVETKTLGVRWDLDKDEFKVKIDFADLPKTKRALLSFIASIYDPLGIVAPLVTEGRLIMQDLCRMQIYWDDKFSGEFENRILEWVEKCNSLGSVKVPRCLKPVHSDDVSSIQLHMFSDASQNAYGAVAYLRIVDNANSKYCVFVLGRARVAPLKCVSIPRLELTAATLAVKLSLTIKSSLHLHFDNIFFWTDSTTVLRYIRNDKLRYKTFVANRVALIRDGSEKNQWRYVNTKLNPADEASRAKQTWRWIEGPEFLTLDSPCWPEEPRALSNNIDDLEIRREAHGSRVVPFNPVLGRFFEYYSSWVRLLRAVAWLIKFKEYLFQGARGNLIVLNTVLSVGFIELAEYSIIKVLQREVYGDEIARLESGQCLNRASSLIKLKPLLLNGILRVGGRLIAADLSFDEAHPIILPYKNHVTELIISHYHCKIGHMGRMCVLAQIRSKYWIIKGNAAVRSVLGKCIQCRKLKGKAIEQEMANLPRCRVEENNPPFHNTGVDCFGPFFVKRGRAQVKRYGVIFTCLNVRAVHLELAADMSTGSFINALRKFVARRGQVKKIVCDRGTNFVGAKNALDVAWQDKFNTQIGKALSKKGIDWEFNPPAASHFGGVWERMIGTVRRVLEAVLGGQSVDDDCLYTLFCEVEAIVNSRPLSVVSSDVRDMVPITPNKLLNMGESPMGFSSFDKTECYSRHRWKQVQSMAEQFWCRWRREYLLGLQQRQKWFKEKRNVQIGDVVMIINENMARCHWPLARVSEVKHSKDGLVRSVVVKQGLQSYEKPLSKLVMILEDESNLTTGEP